MGQCDRKNELNYEAESKFLDLARLTERIARSAGEYPCTSSATLKCLCNLELLNASLCRARGVVARRIGDDRVAVEYFEAARSAAQSAVNRLTTTPAGPAAQDPQYVVHSAYDESPLRVLADVYYSYGYFWYERGNFARAKDLFAESINAIAESPTDIDWDSPYTRSAIVYLISGDTESAVSFALRARNICKNTTPTRNREAMLSLVVTTLTLRILETITGKTLIDMRASVEAELEAAMRMTPSLGLGPVACHRRDAELLRETTSVQVPEINYVIDRLTDVERELRTGPGTP